MDLVKYMKVLTIFNFHVAASGKPPDLMADTTRYTGYFENAEGEQLVFQYDRKNKKGTLWHGDYHWEHPVAVENGHCPLTLSRDESEWLRLVWHIATQRPTRPND